MTLNSLDTNGPASITSASPSNQPIRESYSGGSLSMALLQAVEATTGIDALDLPPLHEAIDPDALDALARSTDRSLRVTFEYAGLAVVLDGDGEISVTALDES